MLANKGFNDNVAAVQAKSMALLDEALTRDPIKKLTALTKSTTQSDYANQVSQTVDHALRLIGGSNTALRSSAM